LSSINDNIKRFTGGNSVADGLSSWYSRTGNESLDDAEYRWLSGVDTQGGASNSDMWFNILRSAGYRGSLVDMKADYWASPITFPSELSGLKVWTRFDSGITVTGSGVSQWDDQSGNGNHLKQVTDTNRPSKESDGSILFDGVDNFLKADAFTLVQPETVYILFKQITWSDNDYIFDGNLANYGMMRQSIGGTSPDLAIFAGTALAANSDLALGDYGVASVVFNSTNSLLSVDNGIPLTGDAGTRDMGGFILGGHVTGVTYSNIQVKEICVFDSAHNTATRTGIISYLSNVG